MYIGLPLVSKYVFARYSPIIPKQNNWMPLTKNNIHTRLGHPEVGSPYMIVLIIIKIIMQNAMKQNIIPVKEIMASGTVEKATIPSIAYVNNFQNDHFVFLATLGVFSYSNHFVFYPTNWNNPLE